MLLFKPPHLILTLLPFLRHAIAAAGPAGPSTITTPTTDDPTTPQPPTPNFSLGAKVPFPNQNPFALLKMLFLTCDGLFTFAPIPYTSSSPSGVKISGTLKIQVEASPELPASAFQARHAMWGLWLGAVTQLDERDYRPGIFVMDVRSGGAGGRVRSVGSITYRNDNKPAAMGMGVGAGNGTADGGGGGDGAGAIEPAVAGTGADVTSRRRGRMLRRQQQQQQGNGFDAMVARRQWTAPSAVTNLSFPGFPPSPSPSSNTTISSPAANTNFYNIQITGISQNRISLTGVFTTVYETMVQRASLPDREDLTQEWFYTSERSGYVFGIRPPDGSPVGESPPYEAMMGAMSNLPRALQTGRISVEVMFDLFEAESGERVLQGFLVLA